MALAGDLLLVGAGAVAASINTAAGGGTLLSFPSLLAAGLSPLAANATSTVGLLPGSIGSVFGLRAELAEQRAELLPLCLASVAGGILGAILLLVLGGKAFAQAVPALLLASSALLLAQPLVARLSQKRASPHHVGRAGMVTAVFGVSIYAGYFGAGAGILFLGVMGLLSSRDLKSVNALKVLTALIANAVGAATFVVAELWKHPGALVGRPALLLAIGSSAGGYLGVHLVRLLPAQALRAFASAVGLAIAAWFIFHG